MKKILFYTICCFALSLMACDNDMGVTQPADTGKVTLAINASGASFSTRATVADNEAEAKLEWIDVFVFTAGADNAASELFYHERIDHSSATEPHTLGLDLNSVTIGQKYYVDVIANSQTLKGITGEMSATITDRADLFSQLETTEYIQMTGTGLNNTPSSFLMDGMAYIGTSEPTTAGAVVLRARDDISQTVAMNVTLRRAAAKVVFNFNIATGTDANFISFGISDGATEPSYTPSGSYFIDNMKYKAMLMAAAEESKAWTSADDYLRTTTEIPYGDYLTSQASGGSAFTSMQLTTYVYCHKWDYKQNSSSSLSEIEPSVIVNLPMVSKDGSNNERNYYEISLDVTPTTDGGTDYFALERNHYYVINATINALGGSNPQTRVKLENVMYQAYRWDEKSINVGGDTGAAYLTLNTYHIEMHNESVDSSTLKFASSSEIESIVLNESYYYNKYGNRINLASGDETDRNVNAQINASADSGLNGAITITSPLQYNNADAHKNTIRYLKYTVTNKDGISRTFTVMQYPLIYITNQRGYYSYRSDFKATGQSEPTTYESGGEDNDIVAVSYNQGTYNYSNAPGGYFNSKVAHSTNQQSASYYYFHNGTWGRPDYWQLDTESFSSNNIRMYHVRVTATSDDYTIGVPRITNGITDAGPDNAKLVSPSFMIASRLGVITSSSSYSSGLAGVTWEHTNGTDADAEKQAFYANHCENYVETYQRVENGVTKTVHLDDWRLPTAAELNIIIGLQGTNAANTDYKAIDYLLNAGYYYSASGPQANENRENNYRNMTSVRCVRDAYDAKTPPVTTNE